MSTSISQILKHRQAMVKYAIKNNNNADAARKYYVNREYVRFWRNRYDGTLESLKDHSKAPKNPVNKQEKNQIKLIEKAFPRNKNKQKLEYYVSVRKKGYKYSYHAFLRMLKTIYGDTLKQNKKYKSKEYNTPKRPGEKIQCDVKFVPNNCYRKTGSFSRMCQYTFIDEATRLRFLYATKESNTYESTKALNAAVKFFKSKKIEIKKIQTDNGFEFTTTFNKKNDNLTMFETRLEELGISYQRIKPYTPRHNGKVERSHRNDNERFYSRNYFKDFETFKKKLENYNKRSNNFPILSLKLKTPLELLREKQLEEKNERLSLSLT